VQLRLLDLLVCPIAKTPLELVVWESSVVKLAAEDVQRAEWLGLDSELFAEEIVTGVLLNRARKIVYPIYQGIPRMLIFPTGVARNFARQYAERLARELPGFALPHAPSQLGEDTVLRTFSQEWIGHDWSGLSYWGLEPEMLYRSMDFLLDLSSQRLRHKLILEVGIGIGGIADYVSRSQMSEVVGIDLSYAVDPAFKHFGGNRFLHIVQASIFAPPFREACFDFVYSQGVLHHTFSTKAAFEHICRLPKHGGRLYVWVYSPFDEQRTLKRRLLMYLETFLRPLCWRLPDTLQTLVLVPLLPLYLLHQRLRVQHRGDDYVPYGWREALHAARDRFSPRYAHRHTEEEVCDWFYEASYTDLVCLSKRPHPPEVPLSLVYATAVDGMRA
jgi:uncharacterized protein YbaR (Trm112 family)/SAM-dependent methyltransferase